MYNIQPILIAIRRKVLFKEKSGFLQVNTEENTKKKYTKFGSRITKDICSCFFGGWGEWYFFKKITTCIFKSLK